jgi:hypothetical protein
VLVYVESISDVVVQCKEVIIFYLKVASLIIKVKKTVNMIKD